MAMWKDMGAGVSVGRDSGYEACEMFLGVQTEARHGREQAEKEGSTRPWTLQRKLLRK